MTDGSSDHRHRRRIKLMQQLFAATFTSQRRQAATEKQTESVLGEILRMLPEIDDDIRQAAPERPLDQMNKLDLAILRLIVFEFKKKQTPEKVLINEAVELAKAYGSQSSPRLVNGVLGTIILGE